MFPVMAGGFFTMEPPGKTLHFPKVSVSIVVPFFFPTGGNDGSLPGVSVTHLSTLRTS